MLSGCAHQQLRWNTTHQAKTLSDIYEQQVLDNLAMFVHDPNALPFFAYPNTGRSDVTDKSSLGSDTSFNRNGFTAEVLKLSGGRDMYETWSLTPVYDPRRLELMRCAYQHAVFCAGIQRVSPQSNNFDAIQRTFYLGSPSESYVSKADREAGKEDLLSNWTASTGRTTPASFNSVRWLAFGQKKDVPDAKKCRKKGHYCGTYVWVCPGGQDELTKLTITILDYAFSPQAPRPSGRQKDVTWFIDKDGNPTEQERAAQVIRASLPYDAIVRLKQGSSEGASTLPFDDPDGGGSLSTATIQEQRDRDPVVQALDNSSAAGVNLPPIVSPRTGISPLELELQLRNPQGGVGQ